MNRPCFGERKRVKTMWIVKGFTIRLDVSWESILGGNL